MNSPVGTATRLMLAAFGAATLLHVDRAPLWCLAMALAAILWHLSHSMGRARLPPRAFRTFATLALFAGVAASFRTLGGLSAGSALLLVMGAAKLLEIRSRRDMAVIAAVSMVLTLAACLDRQSLPRVPLYLICGWTALASIAAMGGARASVSAARAFGTAGRALLLALPLAAMCFLLVPRLQGALWSMPPGGAAQTGLADEMTPGSISELSASEEIVFRVRFDGPAPPAAQRYWRGPVLHDFDGATWRRKGGALGQQALPASAPLRYHVLMEPTGRNYLFGLDRVAAIEGQRNFITFDSQVLARRPITDPIAYDGISYLQTRYEGGLSTTGRNLDTALPAGRNVRSLALARQLRAAVASDSEYARVVLDHFRDSGLEYTLSPPPLGADSVDDLLFDTRRGFCGHFASAYATLMRAAGVPARVVTGYLGATWNAVGGYYTVRQSQAHAWTEIWIDGEGWVRIDPTAVVAPERLQQDARDLLSLRGGAMQGLFGDAAWLQILRDSWDASNNWWQQRVVNFNRSAQLDLLKRLGLGNIDYPGMAMLLAAGALAWGLLLWLISLRQPRGDRPDATGRIWLRFIRLLQSRGVVVAAHEGPRTIAMRAAKEWPAAAAEIDCLARDYEQLRFGTAKQTPEAIRSMRSRLRKISRATAAGRRQRTTAATPE